MKSRLPNLRSSQAPDDPIKVTTRDMPELEIRITVPDQRVVITDDSFKRIADTHPTYKVLHIWSLGGSVVDEEIGQQFLVVTAEMIAAPYMTYTDEVHCLAAAVVNPWILEQKRPGAAVVWGEPLASCVRQKCATKEASQHYVQNVLKKWGEEWLLKIIPAVACRRLRIQRVSEDSSLLTLRMIDTPAAEGGNVFIDLGVN